VRSRSRPALVTPMSQIVGAQAVLNVLSGRRWHIVPDEMKAYLRKYGAARDRLPRRSSVCSATKSPSTCARRPRERDARGLSRGDRRTGAPPNLLSYALFRRPRAPTSSGTTSAPRRRSG